MSARTRSVAGPIRGRTHRSAPTRSERHPRTNRNWRKREGHGAGRSPPPTGGRSRAVRPGTAGCSYPALRKRHRWCAAVGRCRHRPLRPAGGRGTARRVVVPYGWLRRAAAIALGSGAQRSVCARGREEIGGKRSRNHPRRGHQRRTIPQSRLRRASSLCTREPFPAGDGGIGRGMRIAASLRSSQ